MRPHAWTVRLIGACCLVVLLAGCAENSMVLKGQVNRLQQERLAMSHQLQEFQKRTNALDQSNHELESLVAQYQREAQLLNDQLTMTREQLTGVTSQLAKINSEKEQFQERAQALTASMRSRGGVTINPNNSYLSTLPQFNHPEVHVRRDGDVIRVELPDRLLFEAGSARLTPEGGRLVTGVAAELARAYPDLAIGIHGHTDSEPVRSSLFRGNLQLSLAQAQAVYEVLVSQSRIRPGQLLVAGHGPNQPVVSNATAAGKQRNRRVELVVYPEKSG